MGVLFYIVATIIIAFVGHIVTSKVKEIVEVVNDNTKQTVEMYKLVNEFVKDFKNLKEEVEPKLADLDTRISNLEQRFNSHLNEEH